MQPEFSQTQATPTFAHILDMPNKQEIIVKIEAIAHDITGVEVQADQPFLEVFQPLRIFILIETWTKL